MIRALTLWQPMAWAISDYTKRVENRPWKPWKGVRTFAIHAGQTYHQPHAEQIADVFGIQVPSKNECPRGAIVAVVDLCGYVHEDDRVELVGDDPWFSGPYGWMLENVRRLDPVPCKGERGLWLVSPEVEAQIREQVTLKDPSPANAIP